MKFIDEEKVFEVNSNAEISVTKFGIAKCVIVDNFYKNPDLVQELAFSIPPSANKRIRGNNPALRSNTFYTLDSVADIFDVILRKHWPEIMNTVHPDGVFQKFREATFMVNVMDSNNLPAIPPHLDNPSHVNFASTIYLNSPEQCNGGTSFYTYNGRQDVQGRDLDGQGTPITEYITDSIGAWEMIGMAEMKYNRMVLYNQAVLHSAYVKPHMYTDTYRVNQQFFI